MIWKMSPLVKFEILGVLVNTLTLNHSYPVPILQTVKDLIRLLSTKRRFGHPLTVKMLKDPKHL